MDNGGFAAEGSCDFAIRQPSTGHWYNFTSNTFTPAWSQTSPRQSGDASSILCRQNYPFTYTGEFQFFYRAKDVFNFRTPGPAGWASRMFTIDTPDTTPPESFVSLGISEAGDVFFS